MREVIMAYSGEDEDMHDLTRVGELVRCKNCMWYRKNDCYNPHGLMFPDPDDYCSGGERKEDDE